MALNLPRLEEVVGSLTGRITSTSPWFRFTALYLRSQSLIVHVAPR